MLNVPGTINPDILIAVLADLQCQGPPPEAGAGRLVVTSGLTRTRRPEAVIGQTRGMLASDWSRPEADLANVNVSQDTAAAAPTAATTLELAGDAAC